MRILELGFDAFLDQCVNPEVQRIVMLDGPTVLGWDTWHEIDERYAFGTFKAVLTRGGADGPDRRVGRRAAVAPSPRRHHAGRDGGGTGRRPGCGQAGDGGLVRGLVWRSRPCGSAPDPAATQSGSACRAAPPVDAPVHGDRGRSCLATDRQPDRRSGTWCA